MDMEHPDAQAIVDQVFVILRNEEQRVRQQQQLQRKTHMSWNSIWTSLAVVMLIYGIAGTLIAGLMIVFGWFVQIVATYILIGSVCLLILAIVSAFTAAATRR